MTATLTSPEELLAELSLNCSWGPIVQPYLDECTEKPVWGVECAHCHDSWATACQPHHEMTHHAYGAYECEGCGKQFLPHELAWCKL